MLGALRALPLLWRVLAIAGVLSAATGLGRAAYSHIRAEGYREGFAKAEARCEDDKRKQEIANQNAIAAANKQLVERADELVKKELQLDDYVKAIDAATGADPRGGDRCLDADGVRRLNAIR